MKIAILHGPNLNRLGKREPAIYGTATLKDLEKLIRAEARALGVSVVFFQSNHEGALIDKIHALADAGIAGYLVNFGAYTHTSIALHDALTRLVQVGKLKANPLTTECAAISVGVVGGTPVLDLPYVEDSTAETDMNVVMTGAGGFVEVQGTAEGAPFSRGELDSLLELATAGNAELARLQALALEG